MDDEHNSSISLIMKTQEEQFIKVTGVVHDPFEGFTRHDPFTSLEIFDTAIAVSEDNQAFSQKIIQYSTRNYRSNPTGSLLG